MRPVPPQRRYEGWSFRSFGDGCEAFRVMEQAGASPDVARLSDAQETSLSMATGSAGSAANRLGQAYLRMRGHEGGCVAIVGFEGEEDDLERRRLRCAALLRAGGGVGLGRGPGEAWLRGRYAGPYLRDTLLDHGVMVETLETATTWSNLGPLYAAVSGALRDTLAQRGTPPLVMCHVSHLYRSGASLYFSFLARQEQETPLEQWRAAKTAASDAIVAARRNDHPPPRGGPRPRALDASRGRRPGARGDPGRKGAPGPRGDHEPGEAAAGVAARPPKRASRSTAAPATAGSWPAASCAARPFRA